MDDQSGPSVAAFDLDGTLTEGGSVFLWLRYLAGSARAYRAALRLAVPLAAGALRSGASADRAKERLFRSLLAGRDVEEVRAASHDFELEHLARAGRRDVLERLAWHLEQGHDVVIVSASPQLYVDVVADALGASGGLGTRLAVDTLNRLTGGYLGRNCRGSEKLRRLREWIDARGYAREPVLYAYGNSRGDRRMLAEATHPFNVGRLGRLGSLRRYPRPPALAATAAE
ncbi:MAG: HAD-IB family hydrolase [Acidimicrobiales bacterium]|jgi:phosphatidylglycerophosphatase C